ncbi:hypothetical protein ACJX0J_028075, partial [Zea mays]
MIPGDGFPIAACRQEEEASGGNSTHVPPSTEPGKQCVEHVLKPVTEDVEICFTWSMLHQVDGLNQSEVRRLLGSKENCNRELVLLTGQSGTKWGM